jgi:hypothetical protein
MSEELRRALYASNAASLDIELFIPDLVGVTEILSEEHRKKLCRHLPARAEGNKYSSFGIYVLLPLLYLFHSPPPLLLFILTLEAQARARLQLSQFSAWPTPEHSSGMYYNLHGLNLVLGHVEKNTSKLPGVSGPDEEEKNLEFLLL